MRGSPCGACPAELGLFSAAAASEWREFKPIPTSLYQITRHAMELINLKITCLLSRIEEPESHRMLVRTLASRNASHSSFSKSRRLEKPLLLLHSDSIVDHVDPLIKARAKTLPRSIWSTIQKRIGSRTISRKWYSMEGCYVFLVLRRKSEQSN